MSPASTTAAPRRPGREPRRQLAQRAGQDVREQQVDLPGELAAAWCTRTGRRPRWRWRSRAWRQRLRVDVEAVHLAAPSLAAASASTPEPQPKSMTRAVTGAVRIEPGEAQRGGRVRAGAEGEPRIQHHHHRAGVVTGSWRGHTHSRAPKRMAWKSLSHSRSQARSATSARIRCVARSSRAASRRARRPHRAAARTAPQARLRPQAQLAGPARAPDHRARR